MRWRRSVVCAATYAHAISKGEEIAQFYADQWGETVEQIKNRES
jgi:hypothetical protein